MQINNSSQQNQPEDNSYSRKTGSWMTFVAWIVFIAFLGYLFNHFIQKQNNPNQSVSTAIVNGVKEITLTRNKHGHYVANGEINGQSVIFLLDTGATDVAMSAQLAEKLQLKQGRRFKVSTANGIVNAHRTRVDSVAMGKIELNNVAATILKDGPENQVLLGMAFLKHLEFVQKGNQLTIRQ